MESPFDQGKALGYCAQSEPGMPHDLEVPFTNASTKDIHAVSLYTPVQEPSIFDDTKTTWELQPNHIVPPTKHVVRVTPNCFRLVGHE